MTALQSSTFDTLPATRIITVKFSPCPVCGKSAFNAPQHRRNHIAKCEAAALAADAAAGVFECEELGMDYMLPAALVAQAHHVLRVVEPDLHGTAQQMAQNVAERLADYIEDTLCAADPHIPAAGSELETHIDAAYWIGEVAWEVSALQDRMITAICEALESYRGWSYAVEQDRFDMPRTWDMEVEKDLAAALEAARGLAVYCKANPDTGMWTQGAYDQVEAAALAASGLAVAA